MKREEVMQMDDNTRRRPSYRKAPRELDRNRDAWSAGSRLLYTDTDHSTIRYPSPIEPIRMPRRPRRSALISMAKTIALVAAAVFVIACVCYLDGV